MRRFLTAGLSAAAFVGLALAACSDDSTDATTADAGKTEAGPGPDTSVPDTSLPDTSKPDSSEASTPDAGPTITATVGTTGWIRVFNDGALAQFREDDTILRASNAPDCVAHVSSGSKPFSNAGKITIGGTIVGADGGPPAAIEITQDPMSLDYFAPGDVFPATDTLTVQVAGAGTVYVPALAVQTLSPPAAAAVTVTKPTTPDANMLAVPSAQPFDITWTVPGGNIANKRIFFGFWDIAGTVALKRASIFCGYPLAQGTATIPANLLADVKSRLGAGANGTLHVSVGGQKEVSLGGVSYVIEVTRPDATTFAEIPAELN